MELEECAHVWFVRFALDRECRVLACGNTVGSVLVWDPHALCRRPLARLKRAPGSKTTVSSRAPAACHIAIADVLTVSLSSID